MRTVTRSKQRRAKISPRLRTAVFKRDGHTCVACGWAGPVSYYPTPRSLEIDHIVPFSKGGTNDASNLQVLCTACNLQKSNKLGGPQMGLPLFGF